MRTGGQVVRARYQVDVYVEVDIEAHTVDRVVVDTGALASPTEVEGAVGQLVTPADRDAAVRVLDEDTWPSWDFEEVPRFWGRGR